MVYCEVEVKQIVFRNKVKCKNVGEIQCKSDEHFTYYFGHVCFPTFVLGARCFH